MMPGLTRCEDSGIAYFTDDELFDSTGVRIAFATRLGGASDIPFDTLNLADHVGDDPASVSDNRRRVLGALGAESGFLLANPSQVHGTEVWHVRKQDESLLPVAGDLSQPEDEKVESDAMVIAEPGIAGMLCFADCVPVILVADDGICAIAHAGWRGLVGGIVEKSVQELRRSCKGAMPDEPFEAASDADVRIFAYIGPCIRRECFEVGQDVAAAFESAYGPDVVVDGHVDLPLAIRLALLGSGVQDEDIVDLGICTSCDREFYSYRASGGKTGRHGAIALKAR